MLLLLLLLSILSLVLHVFDVSAQPPVFVEQPVSRNVSLDGPDVVFNCTSYTLGYHWLVNGGVPTSVKNKNRGLEEISEEVMNENLMILLLKVPATSYNNDITVRCVIYTNTTKGSDTAVLKIQGLLNPVTDLQAMWINSTVYQVQFNPPETLDGVPIRNYTIEVYSQDHYISVSVTDAYALINECDICQNYTINVSAVNDVGHGSWSSFVLSRGFLAPDSPINTTLKIDYQIESSIGFQVLLFSTIYSRCSHAPSKVTVVLTSTEQPQLHELTANCMMEEQLTCDHQDFALSDSTISDYVDIRVNLSSYITPGYSYTAKIVASNSAGDASSSPDDNQPFVVTVQSSSITSPVSSKQPNDITPSSSMGVATNPVPSTTINQIESSPSSSTAAASLMFKIIIALCVCCGSLVILVFIIIFLMALVMRYRRKNSKLKFAELAAWQKQRNAEVVLNTLTSVNSSRKGSSTSTDTTTTTTTNGYYDSPSGPDVLDSHYENLHEIQMMTACTQQSSTVQLVACPAYATLPAVTATTNTLVNINSSCINTVTTHNEITSHT